MTDSEREMLQDREEKDFGARIPFESNAGATYEDSVKPHQDDQGDLYDD